MKCLHKNHESIHSPGIRWCPDCGAIRRRCYSVATSSWVWDGKWRLPKREREMQAEPVTADAQAHFDREWRATFVELVRVVEKHTSP